VPGVEAAAVACLDCSAPGRLGDDLGDGNGQGGASVERREVPISGKRLECQTFRPPRRDQHISIGDSLALVRARPAPDAPPGPRATDADLPGP
jgi:hypothetical protein